jgi:hypothetical protein
MWGYKVDCGVSEWVNRSLIAHLEDDVSSTTAAGPERVHLEARRVGKRDGSLRVFQGVSGCPVLDVARSISSGL